VELEPRPAGVTVNPRIVASLAAAVGLAAVFVALVARRRASRPSPLDVAVSDA
jgi:NAD/NADP transhydrogenase beta subunit